MLPRRLARAAVRAVTFGYDAAKTSPRRSRRKTTLAPEHHVGDAKTRVALTSAARDARRNLPDVAWAVRTHLAHVTQHSYQIEHQDCPGFCRFVERRWNDHATRADRAGRHTLDKLVTLAEKAAVEGGDAFVIVDDEGLVQVLGSHRVGQPDLNRPDDYDESTTHDGVQVDADTGRSIRFAVGHRDKSGKLVFDRWVDAEDVYHHGYFDDPEQVRGVSPVAAALNTWNDVGDARAFALARAKIEQLMGLVLTSPGGEDDEAELAALEAYEAAVAAATAAGEDPPPPPNPRSAPTFDFSDGTALLDLDAGRDAKFLTAQSPHTNFQAFLQVLTTSALKALDIDYVFYDTSHANFSSGRLAELRYDVSSRERRESVVRMRRWIAERIHAAKLSDWLTAATNAGVEIPADVAADPGALTFGFYALGKGWFDPLKETRSDAAQIAAGLTSRRRVVRHRLGVDWSDVLNELAEEAKQLADAGLRDDAALIGSTPDAPPTDDETQNTNAATAAGAAT